MIPTVQIAFDLSLAGRGDFFTLNDPVKGQLGGTVYVLAGDILTDVTDEVRAVTIRRGRPRETDRFDAGQAQIVLNNRARLFDPTAGTAVSPYAPSIIPRKAITVDIGGVPIFSGQIEDWDLQYSLNNDSITVAKASDAFTLINQNTIGPGTVSGGITAGSAINLILDRASWPAAQRDVDAGVATFGTFTYPVNTNALDLMFKMAQGEPGPLFIGKDGTFTFRDRNDIQLFTGITFADDGTGIPFSSINIDYGTELLFTKIDVAYVGGTATATNTTSVTKYGLTTLPLTTYLSSASQSQYLADFYSERYGNPVLRITGLTVEIDALPDTQKGDILGLELGDLVNITYTPNGIGAPIDRYVSVSAIQHDMRPKSHRVTLNFTESLLSFILDDPELGLLDSSRLGF